MDYVNIPHTDACIRKEGRGSQQDILVWEGKVYGNTKASGEEISVLCFSRIGDNTDWNVVM